MNFFVFDNVKIIDSPNCAMYQVDSEEGEWNDAADFKIATIQATAHAEKAAT